MTTDAYAALSSPTAKRGETSGVPTERLSLASAAVCLGRPLTALEFVVDGNETTLVTQTIRETAGDALERLAIAPVDGTPRYRIIAVVKGELVARVMNAVMNALEKSG